MLNHVEGEVFEDLVRQVLRDRPLDRRILPHGQFDFSQGCKSYVLPRVQWDENIEIDILVSLPSANAIIVGSCKRHGVDCGKRKLRALG